MFSIKNSVACVIALIVATPIIFILLDLLNPVNGEWLHFGGTLLGEYLGNTLLLLLLVGILSLLFSVFSAWLIATSEFPGRRILSWALLLPLAIPPYILAYIYADFLDFNEPLNAMARHLFGRDQDAYFSINIRSLPGAAFVMSLGLYPYIYLLAKTAFYHRSATLYAAARVLGATQARAFIRIVLPSARAALIGGLALVLMETLADFGVAEYFGVPTFSTGIFRSWFAMGERAAAIKLAGVMLVFVLALVSIEKFSRKGRQTLFSKDYAPRRKQLRRCQALLALILCFIPVFLGFILPFLYLAYYAFSPRYAFYSSFLDLAWNSISVALMTSVLAVVLALYLVWVLRHIKSKLFDGLIRIASLGYALPGMMLAVGLLVPVSHFERSLADFTQTYFGWNLGLFLSGTLLLLLYAYTIRFLTPAFNACDNGLDNVPLSLDHAARSLGARPWTLLRRVQLPLLYKSLSVAGLLVFVDTMRELPLTLMLRPFNFETLATRVYRLASDERLADASLAAMAIVVLGLAPVIILNYLAEKKVA